VCLSLGVQIGICVLSVDNKLDEPIYSIGADRGSVAADCKCAAKLQISPNTKKGCILCVCVCLVCLVCVLSVLSVCLVCVCLVCLVRLVRLVCLVCLVCVCLVCVLSVCA